jgi:hypothetical protein
MFRVRPTSTCHRESENTVVKTRGEAQRSDFSNHFVGIVVCFMCVYDSSYVYSQICVKTPCLDNNLCWTKFCLGNTSTHVYSDLCSKPLAFWALFTKFVSCCDGRCAKSHKDRAVIVPHELICRIHGLVVTTRLEDELVSCGNCWSGTAYSLLDHNAGGARRRKNSVFSPGVFQ